MTKAQWNELIDGVLMPRPLSKECDVNVIECAEDLLDCTRRLMAVDARVLIESELKSVLADRDGLVKLDHEKNNKIEEQVVEIDGLKKKVAELEAKVKEQANILALGKPAADAVQQATTDLEVVRSLSGGTAPWHENRMRHPQTPWPL